MSEMLLQPKILHHASTPVPSMNGVLRINGTDQRIAYGHPDMTPKPRSKKVIRALIVLGSDRI